MACVAAIGGGAVDAAVPSPYEDPFYAAPDPIPSLPPGWLIDSRPVTIAAAGVPLPFKAWHLKYVSTNAHDRPVVDVATVIVPLTPSATTPRPLVSYQTAEDSLSMLCAPSYRLRLGTDKEGIPLPPLLAAGWAVVVPDYEGLESQYGAGIQAGHAVLDGIRAALGFEPAGLSAETPVGLWGYSGGALATAWASELAPTYAPEIGIAGIAEGGVPPNIYTIGKRVDGGVFSGFELAVAVGLSPYPEMATLMNEDGVAMAEALGRICSEDFIPEWSFKHLDTYTTVPNAIDLPWVREILAINQLGSRTPAGPLFIYQSMNDTFIPMEDVNALVEGYCDRGATVAYYQDAASSTSALRSAVGCLPMPSSRRGSPGCRRRTRAPSCGCPASWRAATCASDRRLSPPARQEPAPSEPNQ